MENEQNNLAPEEQPCEPRPRWQVWAARVGLVLFILLLIMYYVNLLGGGA